MDRMTEIKINNLVQFKKLFTAKSHLLGSILCAHDPATAHLACKFKYRPKKLLRKNENFCLKAD